MNEEVKRFSEDAGSITGQQLAEKTDGLKTLNVYKEYIMNKNTKFKIKSRRI